MANNGDTMTKTATMYKSEVGEMITAINNAQNTTDKFSGFLNVCGVFSLFVPGSIAFATGATLSAAGITSSMCASVLEDLEDAYTTVLIDMIGPKPSVMYIESIQSYRYIDRGNESIGWFQVGLPTIKRYSKDF